MARDNPETNPVTIKPETASHVAEGSSWVPLPSCSPPGCPFPIKSLALSAHVSPRTIHFRVLDKSPLLGPGGGSPSCNTRKRCPECGGHFSAVIFFCRVLAPQTLFTLVALHFSFLSPKCRDSGENSTAAFYFVCQLHRA